MCSLNGGMMKQQMPDRQNQLARPGHLVQLGGVGHGERHRLFHQKVPMSIQHPHSHRVMLGGIDRNHGSLDQRVLEDPLEALRQTCTRVHFCRLRAASRIDVADPAQLGAGHPGDRSTERRAPTSRSDESDADGVHERRM